MPAKHTPAAAKTKTPPRLNQCGQSPPNANANRRSRGAERTPGNSLRRPSPPGPSGGSADRPPHCG
eukprot:6061122-Lingulodinium_polyedra.AAC.1